MKGSLMNELPPEGWYDDPEGGDQQRRWDGTAWTDEYRAKPELDGPKGGRLRGAARAFAESAKEQATAHSEERQRIAANRPPGGWYITDVNKGSVNMRALGGTLNARRDAGYRLHSIFEQAGNTVMVFEWVGSE